MIRSAKSTASTTSVSIPKTIRLGFVIALHCMAWFAHTPIIAVGKRITPAAFIAVATSDANAKSFDAIKNRIAEISAVPIPRKTTTLPVQKHFITFSPTGQTLANEIGANVINTPSANKATEIMTFLFFIHSLHNFFLSNYFLILLPIESVGNKWYTIFASASQGY